MMNSGGGNNFATLGLRNAIKNSSSGYLHTATECMAAFMDHTIIKILHLPVMMNIMPHGKTL